MPVILWVPPDPTDLVIQGEEMRRAAVSNDVLGMQLGPLRAQYIDQRAAALSPLILDAVEPNSLLPGFQIYPPMHPDFTPYDTRQMNIFDGTLIRANASVCTPCGAIWPANFGASGILINNYVQATDRFAITGVTRDSAGSALGNCDVTVFEMGRIAVDGAPVVGQTISDGSGNYSVPVPMNTYYEVIVHLSGSPDRAGISLRTVTPVVV